MFSSRVATTASRSYQVLLRQSRNRSLVLESTSAAMTTISDAIKKDHRELEHYYDEVVSSSDHDHQQRYGNQFIWELARHSIAEELIVYPAFEKYMGRKGHDMAESDRKEHHKVKELLADFQATSATDSSYVPKLRRLMEVLKHHINDEEQTDLPALEKALTEVTQRDSEDLAKDFERTKMFVPTRSHPSAGEDPKFESAMGMLAAPIDKLSDMFRKFPREDQKKL